MLIIGHRGAAGLVAENTIGSFKKAQELGVDMLETDLRLNSDGQIVLSHNFLKKQNQATLEELLQIARVGLNLEVKESGFEFQLVKLLKNFSFEVLVSSKYPSILKKIRTLDEKIKLGLILGENFFLFPLIPKLDRTLQLYSLHPKSLYCNKLTIKYLKKLNKKIFIWTVNDQERFEKLKEFQIDGVFTDYPNLIRK